MSISLMAIIAWVEFYRVDPGSGAQLFLLGLAVVGAVGGVAAWIVWLLDEATRIKQNWDAATEAAPLAMAREKRLTVEAASRLTPDQAEALGRGLVEYDLEIEGEERKSYLTIYGVRMPWDFVPEFASRCDDKYLARVGRYTEGTQRRAWAEAITRHMIERRYATPAAGPHPAAWVPGMQEAAWKSVWYEMPKEDEG